MGVENIQRREGRESLSEALPPVIHLCAKNVSRGTSSERSVCKSLRKTGWVSIHPSSSFWRRKHGLAQPELHSSALRGLGKCAILFYILSGLDQLIYILSAFSRSGNARSGYQLLVILISLWTALKNTFSWMLNFPIYCPVSVMLDNKTKISGKIRILQTPQKATGTVEKRHTEKTLWFKYPQAYLSHLGALKEMCSRIFACILLTNYSAGRDCTYMWGQQKILL